MFDDVCILYGVLRGFVHCGSCTVEDLKFDTGIHASCCVLRRLLRRCDVIGLYYISTPFDDVPVLYEPVPSPQTACCLFYGVLLLLRSVLLCFTSSMEYTAFF